MASDRPAEALLVRDVMTPAPAVLHATHSVRAALRVFDGKRFEHLPVVLGRRVVGILSDRDIHRVVANRPGVLDMELAGVMTPKPKAVSPDTSLFDAADLLLAHEIHCLPVLNHDVLVGIVTTTDLLRGFMRLCAGRREQPSQPSY